VTDVFRPGGVSYLRIPASDPRSLAEFYRSVFGWNGDPERGSFEDGSGHVIGHFTPEHKVAGEDGIRPYIYVDDVDSTLTAIRGHGGAVVTEPYPEGNLRVAVFRDPTGNVVGVWQRA
jgi:predicted enzyme related to lactoylglutathione lyase